jgi:hypothetical protein
MKKLLIIVIAATVAAAMYFAAVAPGGVPTIATGGRTHPVGHYHPHGHPPASAMGDRQAR